MDYLLPVTSFGLQTFQVFTDIPRKSLLLYFSIAIFSGTSGTPVFYANEFGEPTLAAVMVATADMKHNVLFLDSLGNQCVDVMLSPTCASASVTLPKYSIATPVPIVHQFSLESLKFCSVNE